MRTVVITSTTLCALSLVQHAAAQGASRSCNRNCAVKESVARNQAALEQYTWTEQTNVSLKGDVKKAPRKSAATDQTALCRRRRWAPCTAAGNARMRKRIVEHKKTSSRNIWSGLPRWFTTMCRHRPRLCRQHFKRAMHPWPGRSRRLSPVRDYVKPGDTMAFNFAGRQNRCKAST